MGTTIDLSIAMTATDAASGVIRGLLGALGPVGGALAGVALAATGAAVALGVQAVQAAGDFQESLDKVQAYAGLTKEQTDAMGQSILQMAPELGQAPKALADALYFVASAGFKGADALSIMRYAGMTSAASNVDASLTTRALVGSLNALGLSASSAGQISDELNATVKNGLLTWQDYGTAVGKLGGVLSATGQSSALMQKNFIASNAALDVFTNANWSAQKASTYLNNTINMLDNKTDSIAKHAKAMGISFDENSFKTMTLSQQMTYLGDITDHNSGAMMKLMGGNSVATTTIDFLNSHTKVYGQTITSITSAMQHGATTQGMFNIAQQGLNFQIARANAAFQVMLITIGQALLPVITKMVAQLVPVLISFGNWIAKSGILQQVAGGLSGALAVIPPILSGMANTFEFLATVGMQVTSFFQQNQWAAAALGVAIGGLGGVLSLFAAASVARTIISLLSFMSSMAATASGAITTAMTVTSTFPEMAGIITSSMMASASATMAAIAPFVLIGLVVAAVVIGIILAVQHWGQISAWLRSVWSAVLGWLTTAFHAVEQPINAVVGWFEQWKVPILSVAGAITLFFLPALIQAGIQGTVAGAKIIGSFIASMWQTGTAAVTNAAKVTASFIGSMIQSGVQSVVNAAKVTASFIGSMIQSGIQAVINGAKVTASFVMSMIKAGIEGWAAAGKLALFIGHLIMVGVQAVIAGAKMAAGFIANLIRMGAEAVIAGAKFVASLIPAIISFVTTSVMAAATAIPPMIAGFIAWTAGAWAAASGTIAATWPVLAIIAAIALLVVGIILLVQHWGAVVGFMRGVWQAFASWFVGALHAVGAFFVSVWNSIVSFTVGVWTNIVNFVKSHALLLLAVVTGPIGALVILIVTHWSRIVSFLSGAWSDIVSIFTGGLSAVWSAVSSGFGAVVSFVSGFVSGIIGFFVHLWDMIVGHSIIPDLIIGIITWFASLPGKVFSIISGFVTGIINAFAHMVLSVLGAIGNFVMGAVHFFLQLEWQVIAAVVDMQMQIINKYAPWIAQLISMISDLVNKIVQWFVQMGPQTLTQVNAMISQITSAFQHLISSAAQWGASLISGFIGGIKSMFGQVGNTLGQLGNVIGQFMPHSPAKQGELSHLNEYGPNFIKGLSQGMIGALPTLQASLNMVTRPIGQAVSGVPASGGGSSGASGGSGAINVYVTISNINDFGPNMPRTVANELANIVSQQMARNMRIQSGKVVIGQG